MTATQEEQGASRTAPLEAGERGAAGASLPILSKLLLRRLAPRIISFIPMGSFGDG